MVMIILEKDSLVNAVGKHSQILNTKHNAKKKTVVKVSSSGLISTSGMKHIPSFRKVSADAFV